MIYIAIIGGVSFVFFFILIQYIDYKYSLKPLKEKDKKMNTGITQLKATTDTVKDMRENRQEELSPGQVDSFLDDLHSALTAAQEEIERLQDELNGATRTSVEAEAQLKRCRGERDKLVAELEEARGK